MKLGFALLFWTVSAFASDPICRPELDDRLGRRISVAWEMAHYLNRGLAHDIELPKTTSLQACFEVGRLFQQVSLNLGMTTSLDKHEADSELLSHLALVRTQMTDIVDFCESGFGPEESPQLKTLVDVQGETIDWLWERTRIVQVSSPAIEIQDQK